MSKEISSNDRFGLLKAIRREVIRFKSRSRPCWVCVCDCGKSCIALEQNLSNGLKTCCGCDTRRKRSLSHIKHGHSSKGNRTKAYECWAGMISRCKPNNKHSKYHGRIGIKVCKRWMKFEHFLIDMGEPDTGVSIERKDVNKGYSKSNCKWIPIGKQSWNRRCVTWVTVNGDRVPLNVAAKKLGVSWPFLKKWIGILGEDGAIKEAIRFKSTGVYIYNRRNKRRNSND